MAKNNESTMKFKADITELKSGLQQAKTAIAQSKAEFDKAASGMNNWKKSSEGVEAKLRQLRSTLTSQKSILENYQQQLQKTEEQYGENSIEAEKLREKIEKQKSTISNTQSQINKYETSLDDVAKAEQMAEKEGISFDEAMRRMKKSSDSLDDSLDDLGDSAEGTSGGFTVMKGALASLVADGIRTAASAMKDFMAETVQVGMNFGASMSKVQAVSGATGSELVALTEKAKQLGADTKFSATEASEAMNYMAMAGWKTEDMLNGVTGVLNLAAASGTDLARTSDIVTDGLTAMGYSAKDAAELSDVMAAATSNANTTVEGMGETFKYVGTMAGSLGLEMGDVALATGLMANAGIKGSMAGTSLNAILTRLATNTNGAGDEIKKLGVSFFDSQGNARDLSTVMEELRAATANMSAEEKSALAKRVAGVEASKGFLAILNAEEKDYNKLADAITNSNGAAAEMSAIMQDNLQGDLTSFGSKLESVQIALYDKLEPALRNAAQTANSFMDTLGSALRGDIDMSDLVDMGANWIKKIGEGLQTNMPQLIKSGLTALTGFTENLRANAGKLVSAGLSFIVNIAKGLADSFPVLVEKVPTIVSNIAGLINDNAPKVLATGVKIIWYLVKGLIQAVPTIVSNIPKIIKAIVDVFTAFGWAKLGKTIITGLKNGIMAAIGLVKSAASNVKNVVVTAIKNLPKTLGNLAKTAIQKFVAFIRQANGVSDAARKIGTVVVNALKNLPSQILKIGVNLVKGLWNGITSVKDWLISKVKGFGKGVLDALKDFFDIHSPSRVMEKQIGKNLALGVANGITKNTKYAKKSASQMASIIVKAAEKRLISYKTKHKMSLKEEMNYWKQIVQTTKKGTDGRMAAEKKYLAAQKKYLAENESIKKKAATAEKKYTDSVKKAYEKLNKDITTALDEYTAKVKERTEAITSSMGLFDAFEKNTEQTGDQLIANLKSQVQGLTDWMAALDSLEAKGIDTGLLDELRKMGVSATGQLEALNSLTEKQLEEYVDLWKQKNDLASQEATKELAGLQTETVEKIASLVEETKKSLTGYKKTYDDALKELGLAVKKQVIGTDKTLSKTAAETILKTAPTVGNDMIQGIIDGLNNRSGKLYSTISSIISSAIAAAQAAAEIHSPSRIMRNLIGKNMIKGMVLGLLDESDGMYNTMQSIVGGAVNAAQTVQNNVGKMRTSLNAGVLSEAAGTVNNINFKQTINSPRALSRKEIYRDTRNLVKLVGGTI